MWETTGKQPGDNVETSHGSVTSGQQLDNKWRNLGGNWGQHLGNHIGETSARQLGDKWKTFGDQRPLGGKWKTI